MVSEDKPVSCRRTVDEPSVMCPVLPFQNLQRDQVHARTGTRARTPHSECPDMQGRRSPAGNNLQPFCQGLSGCGVHLVPRSSAGLRICRADRNLSRLSYYQRANSQRRVIHGPTCSLLRHGPRGYRNARGIVGRARNGTISRSQQDSVGKDRVELKR